MKAKGLCMAQVGPEGEAHDPPVGSSAGRNAFGCVFAISFLLGLLILGTVLLLAWPYLTGSAKRRHPPQVYHSATPMLPPPEHSDE